MNSALPESATSRAGVSSQAFSQLRWQRIVPLCLVGLLVLFGVGAYFTGRGNLEITHWVDHSYEVRLETIRLHGMLYEVQSLQEVYADTKSDDAHRQLESTLATIPGALDTLRRLTADNPQQQARIAALAPLTQQFLDEIQKRSSASTALAADPAGAAKIFLLQDQMDNAFESIRQAEIALQQARQSSRRMQYEQIFLIIGLIFFAAVMLLGFYFRLLSDQVRLARESEKALEASANSYKLLSAKVLDLQDRERRRVARELHDSVGQYLAVLRMNLGRLGGDEVSDPQRSKLHADTIELAEHAVTEVRTISYLLHPPMLEDIGLEEAVRWYANGFAKRSALEVELDVKDADSRLPRELELALFRTLQESLTNVHRHAKASKVAIRLERNESNVVLTVKDDGVGLSTDSLSRFRAGLAGGVGLAGMRERIMELGGTFQVESTSRGTLLRASVPLELTSTALKEFGKLED
ncbi:MAG TPA: ATP-binding protein [Candidatus Acidoferrales bacterium]|nr:ATP-binding protein [Candidatus Acidoferrales bacterium]